MCVCGGCTFCWRSAKAKYFSPLVFSLFPHKMNIVNLLVRLVFTLDIPKLVQIPCLRLMYYFAKTPGMCLWLFKCCFVAWKKFTLKICVLCYVIIYKCFSPPFFFLKPHLLCVLVITFMRLAQWPLLLKSTRKNAKYFSGMTKRVL